MLKKIFYITTPIYYPSAKLHLGHVLTTTMADVLARYKKMMGYEVFFSTGSDEYGQKIEKAAKILNKSPIEYTDKIILSFKKLWKKMNIKNDDFIRTTEKRHYKTVQTLFKKIYDKEDIYKSKYEGFYCISCESFFTKHQSLNEVCPDCGKKLDNIKEETYFFKLSKYQDKLLRYLEKNIDFIKPTSRRNEMINFIKKGLDDLSISRTTFKWGIPVPIDKKHIIYVWFDALTNYLTVLNYLKNENSYKKYWETNKEIVHIIGKDILRFHSIIWPAILFSAGIKLPTNILAHGWIIYEGNKMSKSKTNTVDPFDLIGKYGSDSLRYFLMREMPINANDFIYSEKNLINRINNDLVNDYGNLISRTLSMIEKYCKGIVPFKNNLFVPDTFIIKLAEVTVKNFINKMDKFEISNALKEIFKLINEANKYIEESAPWKLSEKNKKQELDLILYQLMEIIRVSTSLLSPFIVNSIDKIKKQIGIIESKWFDINNLKIGNGPSGYLVKKGDPIFPRIKF